MAPSNTINVKELQQIAKDSTNKETYRQLYKTQYYRIGVGARATSPSPPSFFVEVIVNLSDESKKVNLPRLEKVLRFLKELEARSYSLFYESANCISCETKIDSTNIDQEYTSLKSLIKTVLT
jgi:hypothetical protein